GEIDGLSGVSSLLMVDIDHFKKVNDTCGHLFGDRVLQGVARAIAATVKGRDIAARFGGEEFSVLLPGTDSVGAVCVAEQIREAVSGIRIRRAQSEQTIASVTVSVGVAQRTPGEAFDAWFDRADKALYKAKNNGRNRVERAA
ncbi:MAG TPA: GGDEF domain-containing protein, partial [Burkholderiaceae bacterium]|nr:GGDEF domain-containing protein [Burkholderiaceae bacterium]